MSRIFSRAGLAIAVIAIILVVAIIGYTTGWTDDGGQAIAAPGSPGEGIEGGVVSPLDDPAAFGPPTDTDPAPDIPDFGFGWSASSEDRAMELSRLYGRAVEDVSQRDAMSAVYALPDGTWAVAQSFSTQFVPGPGTTNVETDWVLADSSLEIQSGFAVPESVAGTAEYSTGGVENGVLASFVTLGSDVTVRALWSGFLPEATVVGSRVTYQSVAPDVDLIVESRVDGFEIFLVAFSPVGLEAAEKTPFTYEVENGFFGEPVDGSVSVFDNDGVHVASLPVPRAWDAEQDALMSSPLLDQPGRADAITPESLVNLELDVDPTFEASDDLLRVFVRLETAVDRSELEYPVVLDPTYETLSPHTLTSFNTRVQNGVTRDMSGDAEFSLGTWNSGTNVVRPFLSFSIAPVSNRDLISATLYLWNYHSFSCSARSWSVHLSNSASTATRWTNQPVVYSSPVSSSSSTRGYSSSCDDGWVTANVTSHVAYFKGQGSSSASVALRTNESDNYSWKRFNSRHASSNQPKVVYVVNRLPGAPIAVSYLPPAEGQRGRLQATVIDPDGADVMVSARFSAERRALGSEGAWEKVFDKALGSTVLNGATSIREVDLIGGFEYRVRAWSHDGRVESASPSSWVAVEIPGVSGFVDLPDESDDEI